MGRRVLLVDDNALLLADAEDQLIAAGFEVAASFGSSAETLAALPQLTLDAAVLDVELLDGPCTEVALALRETGVPFVVWSVHRPCDDHAVLSDASWVEKPAPFIEVIASLRTLLTD